MPAQRPQLRDVLSHLYRRSRGKARVLSKADLEDLRRARAEAQAEAAEAAASSPSASSSSASSASSSSASSSSRPSATFAGSPQEGSHE